MTSFSLTSLFVENEKIPSASSLSAVPDVSIQGNSVTFLFLGCKGSSLKILHSLPVVLAQRIPKAFSTIRLALERW